MPSIKSILVTAAIALAVVIANNKGFLSAIGGKSTTPPPAPPTT